MYKKKNTYNKKIKERMLNCISRMTIVPDLYEWSAYYFVSKLDSPNKNFVINKLSNAFEISNQQMKLKLQVQSFSHLIRTMKRRNLPISYRFWDNVSLYSFSSPEEVETLIKDARIIDTQFTDTNIVKEKIEELLNNFIDKQIQKTKQVLKAMENAKIKVLNYLFSDQLERETGVTSFTTCDESDWEKVKTHIEGYPNNKFSVSGKQYFLYNNEDVSEEDFDKYYNKWVEYIEDERADEARNREDFNF